MCEPFSAPLTRAGLDGAEVAAFSAGGGTNPADFAAYLYDADGDCFNASVAYVGTTAGLSTFSITAAGDFDPSGPDGPQSELLRLEVDDTGVTGTPFEVADASVTVEPSAPAAPTGLSIAAASPTEIDLNWDAVDGASAYNVYRSSDGGIHWTCVDPADTSYADTGLSPHTTYQYYVTAVNTAGEYESAASNTVTMATPDTPPVACDQGAGLDGTDPCTISHNDSGDLTEALNCADADPNATLTPMLVAAPQYGTVTFGISESGPTFTYTPAWSHPGVYTFQYAVGDGYAWSNVATVTVDVTEAAPVAANAGETPSYASGGVVSEYLPVTDADNDALTYSIVDGPANGTVSLNTSNGYFTYTPNAGYAFTEDFFTFKASDGLATSNLGSLGINPEDDDYGPTGGTATTLEGQSVDLTADFLRQAGYHVPIEVIDGPSHGSLADDGNYGLIYTPTDPTFIGQDTFTYVYDLGNGDTGNIAGTATIDVLAPALRLTWGASPESDPANNQTSSTGESLACDPTPSTADLVPLNIASNIPLTYDSTADGTDPLPAQYPVGTVFTLSYTHPANGGDVRVYAADDVTSTEILGDGVTSASWTLTDDGQGIGNATGFPPTTFWVEGDNPSINPGNGGTADIQFTFTATLPGAGSPVASAGARATVKPSDITASPGQGYGYTAAQPLDDVFLLHFWDSDPDPGQIQATILSWGDGTNPLSDDTEVWVVPDALGGYDVVGSRDAFEGVGPFDTEIRVTDSDLNTAVFDAPATQGAQQGEYAYVVRAKTDAPVQFDPAKQVFTITKIDPNNPFAGKARLVPLVLQVKNKDAQPVQDEKLALSVVEGGNAPIVMRNINPKAPATNADGQSDAWQLVIDNSDAARTYVVEIKGANGTKLGTFTVIVKDPK